MKILVTGGAGFIGSHLCERLIEEHDVFALDNYSLGTTKNHVNGVNYISGETSDIDKLLPIVPDFIFHLGEYSRVEQSFRDVEMVMRSNKIGTLAVLEYVRKHPECKLSYAASSTRFGDDGDNADASPYAWSKSSNVKMIQNYADWFNIDYRITYFYNVYGGREIRTGQYATIIGVFEEKYKNNQNLTVVSPGDQRRNFTNVNDVVDALILVMDGQGDGYGIGSDESYSILELAKMFVSSDKITMLPPRKGNRMTSPIMSEKTKELGWKPKHKLSDYIKEIL